MAVTTPTIDELEGRLGQPWRPSQRGALEDAAEQVRQGVWLRLCLYHATGAGKTLSALGSVALAGVQDVLVVAPPVTQEAWVRAGQRLGVAVTAVSHAKFRQKGFKVRRDQPLIVDEFHLLGGHTGKGWAKMDRIAKGLQAPLVIGSATPNYNDVERVYCIQHVMDPDSLRGGYLSFLYRECDTRENPFASTPDVLGFRNGKSAEQYLAALPHVHYVEDELIKQVSIADVPIDIEVPAEFETYGYDARTHRIMASQMEARHQRKRLVILDDDGRVRPEVWEEISVLTGLVATPTLIYSDSSTIAEALHLTASEYDVPALLVTGKLTSKVKQQTLDMFRTGQWDILIGTATLATGTDGIDRMCDHLLIVDDTPDDALRRQLMGRILPRDGSGDVSRKIFTRLAYL